MSCSYFLTERKARSRPGMSRRNKKVTSITERQSHTSTAGGILSQGKFAAQINSNVKVFFLYGRNYIKKHRERQNYYHICKRINISTRSCFLPSSKSTDKPTNTFQFVLCNCVMTIKTNRTSASTANLQLTGAYWLN